MNDCAVDLLKNPDSSRSRYFRRLMTHPTGSIEDHAAALEVTTAHVRRMHNELEGAAAIRPTVATSLLGSLGFAQRNVLVWCTPHVPAASATVSRSGESEMVGSEDLDYQERVVIAVRDRLARFVRDDDAERAEPRFIALREAEILHGAPFDIVLRFVIAQRWEECFARFVRTWIRSIPWVVSSTTCSVFRPMSPAVRSATERAES
jgi:hypothetical protein